MRTNLVGALILSLAALTASTAGVRVLESSPQRLVLSWELSGLDVKATSGEASVSFGDQNTDLGGPSDPALGGHSFAAGVPATGEIRVRFEAQEITQRSLSTALETWGDRRTDDPARPVFIDPWISQPKLGMTQGLRTARLVIRPIAYDPASRSIRVLTKGVCTIDFPASSYGPRAPRRSPLLQRQIVNYDIAAGWAGPRGQGLAKAAASTHPLAQQRMLSFTIGDGHDDINEGTTNENGLIVIPGSDLMTLGSSVRTSDIALFGAYKGELPEALPGLSKIPDGVVEIPLIRVDRGRIGYVDEADSFITYVTGLSDWAFDSGTSREYAFRLDRFCDNRTYWVVARSSPAGASMETHSPPAASNATVLTTTTGHRLYTHPTALPPGWEGGLDRMWKKLSGNAPVLDQPLGLVNARAAGPGSIRYWGYSAPPPEATAEIDILFPGGQTVATRCNAGAWYPAPDFGTLSWNAPLRLQANGGTYGVGGIEVRFEQSLDMSGTDRLTIFSPETSGVATYRVRKIPAGRVFVIRIPPNESRMSIVDATIRNDTCSWSDTTGKGYIYYICSASSMRSAGSLNEVTRQQGAGNLIRDLRSTANQANYLIVTDNAFMSAAEVLAAHKNRFGSFDSPAALIVDINDIYRDFAGGNVDPAALRNFLAYANAFWRSPLEYVVLMGNGNWDYKRTIGNEPVFIPTFQTDRDQSQKCVEDYFACLDSGETWTADPDVCLGRIPCNSLAEATAVVEKVRDLEDTTRADWGPWRNRVLLIADDDRQGAAQDNIRDHHTSSETVASTIQTGNAAIDIRKVYLFEYEWNAQYEKPEATQALADEVNNGVSCVNYFGHGSDNLWSDEHILAIDNINNLHNKQHYGLFSSFSCSVGKFDEPGHDALSDALVKYPDAGGVAAIASSRLAYASSNTTLAKEFYGELFHPDSVASVGLAYRTAMGNYSANKQYVLLGDPSIQFLSVQRHIRIGVSDRDGKSIDTLKALQRITVTCTIQAKDAQAATDTRFGSAESPAYIQIGIYNPPDTSERKDGGTPGIGPYTLPGAPLFVGESEMRGGVFSQTVLLPRTLSFLKPGAKITAYAWQGSRSAQGVRDDIIFSGWDTSAVYDTTGPVISIRPVYSEPSRNATASFSDRVTLSLPAELAIDLIDESGIDVSSIKPDEGLTMEIPGVLGKRNVNTKFRFSAGDYRSGAATVSFDESAMQPGTYELILSAQDQLGNTTIRRFQIEVAAKDEFNLKHVFNYPNPMRMGQGTRFFFYATAPTYAFEDDGIRVKIKIYTLSGKLVRVLDAAETGVSNGVPWDGTDQMGSYLGPNVYLYQATARSTFENKTTKSSIQKLVIHPPR